MRARLKLGVLLAGIVISFAAMPEIFAESNHDGRVGGAGQERAEKRVEKAEVWQARGDNNPPGPRGGEGTNWENRPGPQGGPGAGPDQGMGKFGQGQGRRDYDNRPQGGPGGGPNRGGSAGGGQKQGDRAK